MLMMRTRRLERCRRGGAHARASATIAGLAATAAAVAGAAGAEHRPLNAAAAAGDVVKRSP